MIRCFKNVPQIDLFDEETDPHTRYTAIKFSSNPSAIEMSSCKNQYGLDRNRTRYNLDLFICQIGYI